jgi:membrane protease YdiL (CAAX protease family)
MYIEQAYTRKYDFVKYLPFPIFFFLLMLINYAATLVMGTDTDRLIHEMIKQQGEMNVFIQTVAPLGAFLIALLVWVKLVHRQSLTSLTTARPAISWKRFFTSFAIWGGVSAGMIWVAYLTSPENFQWNFKPEPFFALLGVAIILIPLQTSFEEYLFRGYLMQGLGIATRSRLFALLFTSITFGLMHIANPEVDKMGPLVLVYYIGTGLFLGIITLMDEGMELALGFHAANNLVACLLVTSDWSALQTPSVLKDLSEPAAGFDVIAPVFIFYPLLLFVFAKMYGWTGWKERLTAKISLPNKRTLTH